MKKIVLSVFIFVSSLFGMQTLQPNFTLKADGLVTTMLHEEGKLYVGTANGSVQLFDLATKSLQKEIKLPDIKSFSFDMVPAKVYSVDKIDDRILIASQGEGSYRNVWIYEDEKLQNIIDTSSGYMLVKAQFLTKNKIIMATLSNQIIVYDILAQKEIYNNQLSYSSFSDFELNASKTELASTDESGVVHIVDVKTGNIKKELQGQNVDRIYDIDYKNSTVLGAGQDRRLSVYKPFSRYYLEFDFLLYACALSEDASLGAVAYNTDNDVMVFDVASKKRLYDLKDNKAVVSSIVFIDNSHIIVGSDSETINFYEFQ